MIGWLGYQANSEIFFEMYMYIFFSFQVMLSTCDAIWFENFFLKTHDISEKQLRVKWKPLYLNQILYIYLALDIRHWNLKKNYFFYMFKYLFGISKISRVICREMDALVFYSLFVRLNLLTFTLLLPTPTSVHTHKLHFVESIILVSVQSSQQILTSYMAHFLLD